MLNGDDIDKKTV